MIVITAHKVTEQTAVITEIVTVWLIIVAVWFIIVDVVTVWAYHCGTVSLKGH